MDNTLFDLTGRVALVTGASRGIGEQIAITLAAHGAHVILSSRKAQACEAVAERIRAAGGKADVYACHIGDLEQIEGLFEFLDSRGLALDVLVNNAAANPYFGPTVDTTIDAFNKTVDVNIRGYFFMCARAAKRMAKQGRGSIINVASIAGVVPVPMIGIYSITKAAVISMTKTFAAECGAQGVRVNALLPGPTATRFAAALVDDPQARDEALKRIPLGRIAAPDEMAGTVLYLASDASAFTTGSCINVDGGFLAT
ncbi:SDR family oxidoreductase [Paraburkholderia megapolitana]|uniref:NAD(P)-dependent dehydrogenase, short-chain alcohol dehydrogenase family n=1 Tax=Paraburkholderia megapolitana TaxID=420953 RepID=A0A1I3IBY2_9BURK|nr:SDR family oxidoreductase [Paraburkholderia megapolitana]QDQ85285.1 SDR family oxidoreductase [Paraburkholderia megapolitana]SFI45478.1 NAD(P)-dependent dehydrogenase, short-chain alcohol dehydrogenase family [Paraburkholderia megapolitana]